MVHAPERLGDAYLVADRPPRRVEPHPVFGHRANCLDLERVVVNPPADGVAEKPRFPDVATSQVDAAIHEPRELPAVGPDDAPAVVVVIENRDLEVVLHDLGEARVVVVVARHAERLADIPGIVAVGGEHRIDPLECFVGPVQFQPVGSIGKLIFRPAVVGFRQLGSSAVSLGRAPRAGQAAPRRRFPRRVRDRRLLKVRREPAAPRRALGQCVSGKAQCRDEETDHEHDDRVWHHPNLPLFLANRGHCRSPPARSVYELKTCGEKHLLTDRCPLVEAIGQSRLFNQRDSCLRFALAVHKPGEDDGVLEDRRAAFCARLKASRERKGVSLEDIAAPTKISRSLLKGLEDNDLSRWPHGLYRRSYLRDYLRAIDLLEESIVTEFVRLFPDEQSISAGDPADSAEREEPCALSLTLDEDAVARLARARKRMAAAVIDIVVVLTLSGAAWWTMNADIWASGALVTLSYYSIGTVI